MKTIDHTAKLNDALRDVQKKLNDKERRPLAVGFAVGYSCALEDAGVITHDEFNKFNSELTTMLYVAKAAA